LTWANDVYSFPVSQYKAVSSDHHINSTFRSD
jgi:hypothetical protein